MKKILKLTYLIVLIFFSLNQNLMAEDLGEKNISENVISTVNIYNAQIISQNENVFNISFDLKNKQIMQSGLRYGIELAKIDDKGGYITVDYQVYDEKIDLAENSLVTKNISYTAPESIEGEYSLFIRSRNENGLPFASRLVGKINLTPKEKWVNILNETCYLNVAGEKSNTKYRLSQGVDILNSENLHLNCSVINNSTNTVNISPVFTTYYRTIFGDKVQNEEQVNQPIQLKAGEKKEVSLVLPKALNPQAYDIKVSLIEGDKSSNSIITHYVLKGIAATIQNLSLDKDYYKKGEVADISFIWSPPADNFPGARLDMTEIGMSKLKISITNKNDKSCGQVLEKDLNSNFKDPIINIPYSIEKDCSNPSVSAILTSKDGTILDQKNFNFESKSNFSKNNLLPIFIFIIIILVLSLLIYLKKRKKNNLSSGVVSLFFLLAFSIFIPTNFAKADTFAIGDPSGIFSASLEVSLNKDEYQPGETISIGEGGVISFSACANDTAEASVYINDPSTGGFTYLLGSSSGNQTIIGGGTSASLKTANIKAPTTPGKYTVKIYANLYGDVSQVISGVFEIEYIVVGSGVCDNRIKDYCQTGSAFDKSDDENYYYWYCPGFGSSASPSPRCQYPKDTPKCNSATANFNLNNGVSDYGQYTLPDPLCKTGTASEITKDTVGGVTKYSWTCSSSGLVASCLVTGLESTGGSGSGSGINRNLCNNEALKVDDVVKSNAKWCVDGANVSSLQVYPESGFASWQCVYGDRSTGYFVVSQCSYSFTPPSTPPSCGASKYECINSEPQNQTFLPEYYYWDCVAPSKTISCSLKRNEFEGDIIANPENCIIPVGQSGCSVALNWTFTNPINNVVVLEMRNGAPYKQISQNSSAVGFSYPIIEIKEAGKIDDLVRNIWLLAKENHTDGTLPSIANYSILDGLYYIYDKITVSAEKAPNLLPIINADYQKTLKVNTEGAFTFFAEDPENRDVTFVIDWDNNGTYDEFLPPKTSGAISFVDSGDPVFTVHSWNEMGTKTFKVKATDYDDGKSEAIFTIEITDQDIPTGKIYAESCEIGEGQSSCAIEYSFKVYNPFVEGIIVLKKDRKNLAETDFSNPSGSGIYYLSLNNSPDVFDLYNIDNGGSGPEISLDSKTVTATCMTGLSWNGSVCAKINNPEPPTGNVTLNINIKATPTTIIKGRSAKLDWTIESSGGEAFSCVGKSSPVDPVDDNFNGTPLNQDAGTVNVSPEVTTIYSIECPNTYTVSQGSVTEVTVKVVKPIEIEN